MSTPPPRELTSKTGVFLISQATAPAASKKPSEPG